MKPAGWYVLAVVVLLVLVVVIEGARQGRAMRRAKGAPTGSRLVRAGLLGLHEVLEPDRKVEILKEEHPERVLPALPGDPPGAGGAGPAGHRPTPTPSRGT